MKTETLPSVRKRRSGWVLRIVLAAAIIAAASWYVLPSVSDRFQNGESLSNMMTTTDDVNLRSGPGTDYDVLSVVPAGTEVAASTEPEFGFLQVDVEGDRGWMSAAYLSSPHRVIAQSHTVYATDPEPEPTVVETVAEVERPEIDIEPPPEPASPQVAVEEPPIPEPAVAPVYEPLITQSTQVEEVPQPGEKWIDVNRSTRTVTLYNGEIVVAQFNALIGKDMSADGYYSTATGTFYVHVKEKSLVETPFAEGVFLTDFVGFDPDRSNGFHSPVRDEFGNVVHTGGTSTLGCVRLSEDDAIFLFNFAEMGMRVEVHD